ncbi:MAG: hypothetical protein LBN34_02390 [Clostridiales Family XIII bacterium]|jgi:hypothetical protein|nr:hypothetical protein [Clostridiales Family XIII bacterium]
MCEVRREEVAGGLKDFERRILSDFSPDCLPPHVLVRNSSGDNIIYDMGGLVPISQVVFADERDIFVVVCGFVGCLLKCANSLIALGGIACDLDSVYVDERDRFFVVFRGVETGLDSLVRAGARPAQVGSGPTFAPLSMTVGVEATFAPVPFRVSLSMTCGVALALGEMGAGQGLVNSRVCANQLIKRITESGVGLRGLLKQIELVQREWEYILM